MVYEWARGMPFANITQLTDVQVSKLQNRLAKMLVRDGHLSLFYLVIKTDISFVEFSLPLAKSKRLLRKYFRRGVRVTELLTLIVKQCS